jgi:hypothetical protein
MPAINREDRLFAAVAANFKSLPLLGKFKLVGTVLATSFLVVIPEKLLELLTGRVRPNVGRLKTVIPNQIYQQASFRGQTNSTIFVNKKRNGLLIHIAPRITNDFIQDIRYLDAPVKYIVVSNEFHESFAEDAKKKWTDALVITPKSCRDLVEQAVHVDGTLEEHWDTLENDFGFVKQFRFDENSCTTERSYVVDLFETSNAQCLFVGQCGIGNYSRFSLPWWLAGFQGLLTRGRFFRMYYNCFTTNQQAVRPWWTHMVNSVGNNLEAAVFTHGDFILGKDTRDELLKFRV